MVSIDRSILLSSLPTPKLSYGFAQAGFSKEKLLDYDLTQDAIMLLIKSLLEKRDLGRLISP